MFALKNPLWRLVPLVHQHKLRFWGGMSLINVGRLLEAFVPLMLMVAIDRMAAGNTDLTLPVLVILGLMVFRYGAFNLGRRFVREVGVSVAYELRQRLYWHLQLQGPRFFGRYPTGDLMARAINDLQLVRMLIGMGTRLLFVLGFSGLIAFIFMLQLSVSLTLWLLPVLPVIALAGWWLAARLFTQSMKVQEGFSDLSAHVQENLNGIRTVQTHGQEEREIARFRDRSSAYADEYRKLIFYNSALTSCMFALTGVATILILGFGGRQVMTGEISVGTFTAFLFYLAMMLAPVKEAGVMVTLFQRAASATTRLFDVLDYTPEIRDADDATPLDNLGGTITVRNLSYEHMTRQVVNGVDQRTNFPALKGINLDIEAGQMVAILGRIGSGKSTLLRLLVRLLDPPPGTVFLDGRDIRMLPLAQVRRDIALVPQDPFLFADQLGENITYDNPRRPADKVWQAAEAADLGDTIQRFPDRLKTIVGERGVTLSGGQKQRASLARGLIRDTPVLLLDDCFSSVDTETEEKILSELKTLRQGRTTLMVSHRVSTARHADLIVVLDNGVIGEQGDHRSLLAKGGLYAELERVQGQRQALESQIAQGAG